MISPSTLDIIKNPLEFFIMDQFEYEGSWWLPENPVYKISGTLKFHPIEGAYLELIGAFKKFIDFKTLLEPKIILGNTSDGIITLYDCFENRSSFAGLFTSSFYVNVIFKGHHFEKEEDIIFNNLSINYSHLEEWTKISGFIIYPDTDESHRTKNVDVFYTYPQKVEAKLENLNISLDYDFSLNMKGIEEYHLKQITFIKMEPDKPIHYNEFQNNICCHIQNFLSLAMGKAIYSYHRGVYDGKYVSEDEYAKIYERLINAIPDLSNKDLKESLKKRMQYGNEFSLRKRLKEIIKKCNSFTNSLIPNETEFIEDIVNTRNFLTHYDKKGENQAKVTYKEMDNLVKKMKCLIKICFLIEMEISKERIETLVRR